MGELSGMSLSLESENIAQLKKLFPEAVSDGKVDFDTLKELLGITAKDDRHQRYDFSWNGKTEALRFSQLSSLGTLRPNRGDSKDWSNTENLYIEGDNLEVLKLLQKSYFNKIKMIYIDPPYNTGKDFVYRDNFKDSLLNYKEITGQVDIDGNATTTNKEDDGRFHTHWLNMIFPRLRLARNLLTEDGVIFISIDDGEHSNLRKVCDEIFGEENFITNFIWEKTQHFGRQTLNRYNNVDYILCYTKSLYTGENLRKLLVEATHSQLEDAPLYNASNPVNTLVFPKNSVAFNMKDGLYSETTDKKYILENAVTVKNGKNQNEFSLTFNSRWNGEKVLLEHKKGTTYWVKTTSFAIRAIYPADKTTDVSPRQLIFTNSSNTAKTINRFELPVGTSEQGSSEIKALFGSVVFDYPKPTSLIEYLASLLYSSKSGTFDDSFYLLDFFSGSASAAHGVMKLNAKDGGNRKFIMVQLPENLENNLKYAPQNTKETIAAAINLTKSIGVPALLTEVGKERIRRSGEALKRDLPTGRALNPDTGFKVFKLDSSNLRLWQPDKYEDLQTALDQNRDPYVSGRSEEDMLYELILKMGLELNCKVEMVPTDNGIIYSVAGGHLMVCLAEGITVDTAEKMVSLYEKQKPKTWRVIFRDGGFADDSMKINVLQALLAAGLEQDAFFTI